MLVNVQEARVPLVTLGGSAACGSKADRGAERPDRALPLWPEEPESPGLNQLPQPRSAHRGLI